MQFIVVIVKYFCGAKDCYGTPTVLVGIDFAICAFSCKMGRKDCAFLCGSFGKKFS